MQRKKLTCNQCQCTACGEAFWAVGGFDAHRSGSYTDRRCLSAAEMLEDGMKLNSKGFWLLGRPFSASLKPEIKEPTP